MAARGSIQAPGIMRHGPFPNVGPAGHRPLDPLLPPELLENNVVVQGAELGTLAKENQRLAASHVILRQELVIAQQEMQRLHKHVSNERMASGMQMRTLLEKIAKMEADLQAGESVRKELQLAHLGAQRLVTVRQDLTSQIQQMTEELQKSLSDINKIPELHAELDSLRQEHQKLRTAFEYEKGSNIEQVKQMQVMEKNLISIAREVEKLRAEVLNSEEKVHAQSTYESNYSNADPAQQPPSQSTSYANLSYGQSVGYSGNGYSHIAGYSNSSYPDAYGRAQVHGSGMPTEGTAPYADVNSFSF